MGQIRRILRGVAYHRPEAPAGLLTPGSTVLGRLEVACLATASLPGSNSRTSS